MYYAYRVRLSFLLYRNYFTKQILIPATCVEQNGNDFQNIIYLIQYSKYIDLNFSYLLFILTILFVVLRYF